MATRQRTRNTILTVAAGIVVLVIGVVWFTAVSNSDSEAETMPVSEPSRTTEVPGDVQALLDDWVSAWDAGDLAAVEAIVTEDASVYGRSPQDDSLTGGLGYLVENSLMAEFNVAWRGPVVVVDDLGAVISRGERAYDLVGEVVLTDDAGELVNNTPHFLHVTEDDASELKVDYATVLSATTMREAGVGEGLR